MPTVLFQHYANLTFKEIHSKPSYRNLDNKGKTSTPAKNFSLFKKA